MGAFLQKTNTHKNAVAVLNVSERFFFITIATSAEKDYQPFKKVPKNAWDENSSSSQKLGFDCCF